MGLNNLGWPEIAVLMLLVLFVVGPDRLPGLAAEAGKSLRELRIWIKGMSNDLKAEMPELAEMDLASLHPKTFIRKNLWDDPEPAASPVSMTKAEVGVAASGVTASGVPRGSLPLEPGEIAPWDPDTT